MRDAAPIGWSPLVESYINGYLRVHVHLRKRHAEDAASGPRDQSRPTDLCATYEWPRGRLSNDLELDIRRTWERYYRENVVKLDGRVDQVKVAMLVDVPEFLEHREGFTIGGVMPCLERLQWLDGSQECGIDGPELLADGIGPSARAEADGEPNASPRITRRDGVRRGRDWLEIDTQPPYKLVERGPQIVNDIANDRSPKERRRRFGGVSPDDDVATSGWDGLRPKVWLHVNGVSVAREPLDERFQSANVFIRPVNLGGPIQRSHTLSARRLL
jgi:hypothetical protein